MTRWPSLVVACDAGPGRKTHSRLDADIRSRPEPRALQHIQYTPLLIIIVLITHCCKRRNLEGKEHHPSSIMTEEPMELTDEPDNDILQDMDDGQLSEYGDMLKQLGSHPDKVLINTLSMIAEDYSISFPISSNKIYNAIKEFLLSNSIMLECKLPLVYVMDSILKNAKGLYVEIMRKDHQWMKEVYIMLSANEENKSHPHTLARDRLRFYKS